jgi:archaellum component FlaC
MAYTLDYYKNLYNQLKCQIADRNRHNNNIQNEINRLQDAYNKLGNIKRYNANNADKVRVEARLNKVAPNVNWRGFYKKEFDAVINGRVEQGTSEFFTSIDRMHDEIGQALTRKKNELDTGFSSLNWIRNRLNDVDRTIRNWVN